MKRVVAEFMSNFKLSCGITFETKISKFVSLYMPVLIILDIKRFLISLACNLTMK